MFAILSIFLGIALCPIFPPAILLIVFGMVALSGE
jgi:TRAP-type C4-dicarboxylate transport system permease large subunit